MAIDLNDKTANNNTLTNNGATEWTSSLPFAASTIAVDLESTGSAYLQATDSASLSFTGDFTIECWINPESNPVGDLAHYVNKSDDNTEGYSFNTYDDAGVLKTGLVIGNGTTVQAARINHTPTTGEWHHYAATWTTSTRIMQLFRNGTSLGTAQTASVTSSNDNARPLRIGARASAVDRFFDGQIDEVRIWNDVRTSTEISDNYQSELTGSEANLVAYWPFEELDVVVARAPLDLTSKIW